MRVFLAAHAPRFVAVRVVEARFLHHLAAVLDEGDLTLGFRFHHSHHEAHRIDVLRFRARAELVAGAAHRHVHVGAHRALIHIAVARADIAQDRTQLGEVSPGLGGRTHIGAADDLHQRHARTVEIDIGHRRVLIMHQLARILLDMDALDADHLFRGLGVLSSSVISISPSPTMG
jgi:hypothetical protein